MAKDICKCGPANFIWLIVSAAVLAVGVMLLIGGIQMQWTAGPTLMAGLWIGGGILVLAIGKVFKMKAASGCPAHSHH